MKSERFNLMRAQSILWLILLSWSSALSLSIAAEEVLMRVEESDERILVKRGEKTILQYNKQPTEEAADHPDHFSRTGYIHPIHTPSGQVVSGDFAESHPHHHGLFFAWTRTRFQGRTPEFWNQKLEKGRISFVETLETADGNEQCRFRVRHLWEDLTAPDGPVPVFRETWTVTARDAGDERFVFDVESELRLVAEEPLTVEKYHYGGMAIRGIDAWGREEGGSPVGKMITSEGKGTKEGNHTRPRWAALHGPLEEGRGGVAVLGHPDNFRAPQWVRLHPKMPYFAFGPMVEEPFSIEPGEAYRSNFRVVVFDGEVEPETLDAEWTKFSER